MYNEKLGPDAPIIEPRKVNVTISVTLSKTVEVEVNDYKINNKGFDENHDYYEDIDYSDCDLKKAVEEQIILPHKAYKTIMANTERSKKAYEDLKGWDVDDYEVVLE